jgi:ferredoxin-NADP reductase
LVKKYRSRIISIKDPLEGIFTLEFESLSGPYKYHPGQFLHLALDTDYDGSGQWPESRCFSMQSNPSEASLRITYSVKGAFTAQMARNLKVGSVVWLKLPYGNLFAQNHLKENTIFIAGGTGITPFLSLFTDLSFAEYQNPRIYLGFRTSTHNIYQKELSEIAKYHNSEKAPIIKYYYQDEKGFIDIEEILKENNPGASFFISGPPVMIKNFKKFLVLNGINDEQIKTDDWE